MVVPDAEGLRHEAGQSDLRLTDPRLRDWHQRFCRWAPTALAIADPDLAHETWPSPWFLLKGKKFQIPQYHPVIPVGSGHPKAKMRASQGHLPEGRMPVPKVGWHAC